jgi:hypothetical protein
MSVPPAFALSALYEGVLQAALRQFFRRASLEIEPGSAVVSDRPLAIDSITDPSVMRITWGGTGYTLRMPGRSPFTPHQIRMARAIVAVIGARYRAILNPELAAERGEMFRGPIEDRYVGAFFDERPYTTTGAGSVDRIACVPCFSRMRTGVFSMSSTSTAGAASFVRTSFSTCRARTRISRTPARHSSSAASVWC